MVDRIKIIVLLLLSLFSLSARGQSAAVSGDCKLGGTPATVSGLRSSNYLQGIIPYCTITVYLTGTTTPATLYSNATGTALTNPFTANISGQWIFFAAVNQGYDVVASGGIPPNIYPSPQTLYTGIFPSTQFITSAGNPFPPSYAIQFANAGATAFSAYSDVTVTSASPHGVDAPRVIESYDALAFGADPAGVTDSTTALEACINTASTSGAPCKIPAGKFLISQPLTCYTIPPTTPNGSQQGCKIEGVGNNGTQLVLSRSFTVPPTKAFGGQTFTVQPAAIDIQGVGQTSDAENFQFHSWVKGLEIAPVGCETNPGAGEPSCPFGYTGPTAPSWLFGGQNGIAGIAYGGAWFIDITDNSIHNMGGDGIWFPLRLDQSADGDIDAAEIAFIKHNSIKSNGGWGINVATAGTHITLNLVEDNALGGVLITDLFNFIDYNTIATNGCGISISGTNWTTGAVTCTTNPLGAGLEVMRGLGASGGPYSVEISNNEFDSNAAAQIELNSCLNCKLSHNMFFTHTNGYSYNNTFWTGLNLPSLGITARNVPLQQIQCDITCAGFDADYNLQRPGISPNPLLNPETAGMNFVPLATGNGLAWENYFRGEFVGIGNYTPYAVGSGAVPGPPTMSAPSGGQQSVTAWNLTVQGFGYATAPTLTPVGGDSAWTTPTKITVTQTNGVINNSCTITQAGGPYSRPPLVTVQDNGTVTQGTGATVTVTLSGGSSGTPTACTVTAGGSGYSQPEVGVAPQCQTPPVITATASKGIQSITMANFGNYGPYTPGQAPPTVTATVSDSTGSGFTIIPIVGPVNTAAVSSPPNVIWEVIGNVIQGRGYEATAPTITYSSSATVTPAVANVFLTSVLDVPLTVSSGGSCDAGAAVWLVKTSPSVGSVNGLGNQIVEQNQVVSTSSAIPPATSQLTLKGSNTLWSASGLLQEETGVTVSQSTGAIEVHWLTDINGSTSSGFDLNTGLGQIVGMTFAGGGDSIKSLQWGAGAGTGGAHTGGSFFLNADGLPLVDLDAATYSFFPTSSDTIGTIGTSGKPWVGFYVGAQGGSSSIEILPVGTPTGNYKFEIPSAYTTQTAAVFPQTYTTGDLAVLTSTPGLLGDGGAPPSSPVRDIVTLSSGTATVSTTSACTVSSACIYKLTRCSANSSTAIGSLSVGTITAGTSFVINALTATNTVATGDASTVCWQIN